MAVTLSGIFVSLSCLLKATLGEEIAGGSCDVNDSFMDIALFKLSGLISRIIYGEQS